MSINDRIAVGDWCMTAPMDDKQGSFYQKGIMLTGAKHTHDQLIGILGNVAVVGNAGVPHYRADTLESVLEEAEKGNQRVAIYRWHQFVNCHSIGEERKHRQFQQIVAACIALSAKRKVPYDCKAITTHARNYLRSRFLPFLKPLTAHRENHVYCTEDCFDIFEIAESVVKGLDFNLYAAVGLQPFVSPVHAEKLVKAGLLVKVIDWHGLHDDIMGV